MGEINMKGLEQSHLTEAKERIERTTGEIDPMKTDSEVSQKAIDE